MDKSLFVTPVNRKGISALAALIFQDNKRMQKGNAESMPVGQKIKMRLKRRKKIFCRIATRNFAYLPHK
ncbi:hypothetical protein [Pantoea sp. KPR_PJ]|uniref:hypothetical protein n=1 Tax=Pantoea sp. KPR_PJ TaxID=2738375 RepID=UPI00352862B0